MKRRVSCSDIVLTTPNSPKLTKLTLQNNISTINKINGDVHVESDVQKEIDKQTLLRINSRDFVSVRGISIKAKKFFGDILLSTDDELNSLFPVK